MPANIPSAITPSPVPWQSEAWTIYNLQGITQGQSLQGEADIAFALASSTTDGSRAATATGQISALLGMLQALSSRVNQLSTALTQVRPLQNPPAPRPTVMFIQDLYANIPAAGSYNDGTVIFLATDLEQFFVSVAGAWVPASPGKYSATIAFVANTAKAVTHNLSTEAVTIAVFDAAGDLVVPSALSYTSVNALSVTVGVTGNYLVVVIG